MYINFLKSVFKYSYVYLFFFSSIALHSQSPVFADVLVSDDSTSASNIGSANTSRNIAVAPDGAVYVLYTNSSGIIIARSTDRGQTFSSKTLVSSTTSTEPELAIGNNGDVYVAWSDGFDNYLSFSNDDGQNYSIPRAIGQSNSSGLHMSVYGNNVYIVGQRGYSLFYDDNRGLGTFENNLTSGGRSYVYADVLVDLTGKVWIPTDDPRLYLFSSEDNGRTISEVNLAPEGQVFFSSYSLSDGPCGTFIFTGGSGTDGYKIEVETGILTPILLGENSGDSEGRTLYADNTGTLIDGYQMLNGDLMLAFSSDQGQNFSDPILVASGDSHNIAKNPTNGDILVAYSSGGEIYVSVYENLLKSISLEPASSEISFCLGADLDLNFTLSSGFGSGVTLNAILSDENGSFSNPTDIGQITTDSSGVISVTIPSGLIDSSDYLIILESVDDCVQSNPIPLRSDDSLVITGDTEICIGEFSQLTGTGTPVDSNPWISRDPSIAQVDDAGVVTAINSGTTEVLFTNSDGCRISTPLTILEVPNINGDLNLCLGDDAQYLASGAPTTGGNPWTSSNEDIATITPEGLLQTISAGTITLSYLTLNGCSNDITITINDETTISGKTELCLNENSQLSADNPPSANLPWISSNSAVATISNTGLLESLSIGSTQITFTDIGGCETTIDVSVRRGAVIDGEREVCIGSTTTLSSVDTPIAGNPWTSSNPAVASIDSDGVVIGNQVGTTFISFSGLQAQCDNTIKFEVLPTPIITGKNVICLNSTSVFTADKTAASDSPWTSSNTEIGTINDSGEFLAISTGSVFISFEDDSGCESQKEVQVAELPSVTLENSYFICLTADQNNLLQGTTIETNLSNQNYSFRWFLNENELTGDSGNSLSPEASGAYTVEVTDNRTLCSESFSTLVEASSPPEVSTEILTPFFSDGQSVQVIATGLGKYEYSVDQGPFQQENIFDNLAIGEHVFTANDINGCGQTSKSLFIISYPKFFTPNDDGFNDTWFIKRLELENEPVIYIYDRYGKLIKQLKGIADSWDGTFQGKPLPSSDYWFRIELVNSATGQKENFTAHFSLKR